MEKQDDLKNKAKELRKNLTPQERKLWNILRNSQIKGYKFKRQYVVGNYIVDFICNEKCLVIELDGGQHNEPDKLLYDEERTKYLNSRGLKVLRFWNNDVDNNIESVYQEILKYL